MGSDKGLLPAGDTIWALSVAGKLAPFGMPIVFSVNEQQLPTYSSYISPDRLIPDSMAVNGPLKGLLSVHIKFPAKDLLLLACDMPDLDDVTISKVISAYHEFNTPREPPPQPTPPPDSPLSPSPQPPHPYDFFVYQDQGFAQPFCGIYSARGLAKEYISVLHYDRAAPPGQPNIHDMPDFSLQSMLNKGNTKRLAIDRIAAFRNVNSL